MEKVQLPIGVFDSGMGGLTVLRALRERLPNESFIYLGDTARLPYGTKSQDTVRQYAMQMARILVERRIKALVIACNTATTAALSHVQTLLPEMPVIGVIAPGASAAVHATKNHRLLVLGTETTVASHAYQTQIQTSLPHAHVQARASSLLVALAEEGMVNNAIARAALQHYLSEHTNEDTVLLGCTHFPVFKPLLHELLPEHVRVVDSAEATADATKQALIDAGLLGKNKPASQTTYLVTDSVERFGAVGAIFLDEALNHKYIELVDA